MGYFSVLLDLTNRHCVMVGGGPIAERRILALLEAGAQVTVVSPRVTPTLEALAAEGGSAWSRGTMSRAISRVSTSPSWPPPRAR